MRAYYVYILAGRSRTLYIGMTSDLPRRTREHKSAIADGFTRRYKVDRLVYVEKYDNALVAATRERQLTGWWRSRKLNLIEAVNPGWADLAEG